MFIVFNVDYGAVERHTFYYSFHKSRSRSICYAYRSVVIAQRSHIFGSNCLIVAENKFTVSLGEYKPIFSKTLLSLWKIEYFHSIMHKHTRNTPDYGIKKPQESRGWDHEEFNKNSKLYFSKNENICLIRPRIIFYWIQHPRKPPDCYQTLPHLIQNWRKIFLFFFSICICSLAFIKKRAIVIVFSHH